MSLFLLVANIRLLLTIGNKGVRINNWQWAMDNGFVAMGFTASNLAKAQKASSLRRRSLKQSRWTHTGWIASLRYQ
jgi:hypothetical protein